MDTLRPTLEKSPPPSMLILQKKKCESASTKAKKQRSKQTKRQASRQESKQTSQPSKTSQPTNQSTNTAFQELLLTVPSSYFTTGTSTCFFTLCTTGTWRCCVTGTCTTWSTNSKVGTSTNLGTFLGSKKKLKVGLLTFWGGDKLFVFAGGGLSKPENCSFSCHGITNHRSIMTVCY